MTKEKLICECCRKPAAFVCSTCIPYSTAFCYECAQNYAQPQWVVDYIIEVSLDHDITRAAEWVFDVTVYMDGEYVPFKDYFERQKHEAA